MKSNQVIENLYPHGDPSHRITQTTMAEILAKRGHKFLNPRIYKEVSGLNRVPDLLTMKLIPSFGKKFYWIEADGTHCKPLKETPKGIDEIYQAPVIDFSKPLKEEYERLKRELPD